MMKNATKLIWIFESFFRISAAILILDIYYLHYWRYRKNIYQINSFYITGGIFSFILSTTLIISVIWKILIILGKKKRKRGRNQITIFSNVFALFTVFLSYILLIIINPLNWFSQASDFLLLTSGIVITLAMSILLELIENLEIKKKTQKSGNFQASSIKFPKISSVVICVLMLGTIFIPFQIAKPHFAKDVNSLVLFSQGEEDIHTYRIPSLLVIPKGSHLNDSQEVNEDILLAFCEARYYSTADWGKMDIGFRRSIDGGDNWSPIEFLITTNNATDNIRILSPTVTFDDITGITWLFYTKAHVETRDGGMFLMHSVDGGQSWSEAHRNMTSLIKMVGPGHGIQLKNGAYQGRIVVPGYANGPGSFIIYSDDHGESWQMGNRADTNGECEVAETINGSLYMIIRNSMCNSTTGEGCAKWITWSHDGGITWEPTRIEPILIDPQCMASIHQIPNSFQTQQPGVLFSGPGRVDDRADLIIRVGFNNIQSWSVSKVLYYGPAGYSDLGTGSEGAIYCFFEQGIVDEKEHLTITKFNFEWLE